MFRLFPLFFIFIFPLSAEYIEEGEGISNHGIPDFPLPLTEGIPHSIVADCVEANSGLYFEHSVDLTIPGPQPLKLERSYASVQGPGWSESETGHIDSHVSERKNKLITEVQATYYSPHSAALTFDEKNAPRTTIPLSLKLNLKRAKQMTNCGRGFISGQTNLHNIELIYPRNLTDKLVEVRNGFGEKHLFKMEKKQERNFTFVLSEMHQPNGNYLSYEYFHRSGDDNRYVPSKICSQSYSGTLFGLITFHHLPKREFKKRKELTVTTNDGRSVTYRYKHCVNKEARTTCSLTEVISSNAPPVKYEYEKIRHTDFDRVTDKILPEGRGLSILYYSDKEKNHANRFKVWALLFPTGTDQKKIVTHQFAYFEKDGVKRTEIKELSNLLTRYEFSLEDRLTRITKNLSPSQSYTSQNFYWNTQIGPQLGNLVATSLMDKTETCIYAQGFDYDDSGNILVSTLKGNLTGKNSVPPAVTSSGQLAQDNCETYSLKYSYNSNYQMISATDGEGLQIGYSYDPKTRLLLAKCLWSGNTICMRELHYYDAHGILIKKIVDDGSSQVWDDLTNVAERHITYITPKATTPCLGLPEIVEEKYWDKKTGQEKLVKKIIQHYSSEGNLLQQDVYDANDKHQYSLYWEYDAYGNPTKEVNALGHTILRKYDANSNCVSEHGPREDVQKIHTYDYMNRLIKTEEISANENLITHHRYNKLNQKVSSIDILGNETKYLYDDLGRCIEVTHPPTANENGILVTPTERSTYNELDQCTHAHDAKGQLTKTFYTIRGKPYRIEYPDGTSETQTYSLSGQLSESVAKTGSITRYTYDYLKRPVKQETFSAQGNLLTSQSNSYNAFHLLTTTDAEGHVTYYEYDSAGRQIAIIKEDKRTNFSYDSLGRILEAIEWDTDTDYRKKTFSYDLLDRFLEETTTDSNGQVYQKTSYSYDVDGNQTQIIQHRKEGLAITNTLYNSRKQPIQITDPEGHITLFHYDYHAKNKQGQTVLQTTKVNAIGQKTISWTDNQGRETCLQKQNPLGETIAKQETLYDILGNPTRIIATRYPDQKEIVTLYQYDSANRLISLTEALGTAEQKCTRYQYNAFGQKEKTIKPDGKTILHLYDALGRVQRYYSDNSFDYLYTYDANSNVIDVEDRLLKTHTQRTYDRNDRLIQERIGNGLTLTYRYDRLDRPTLITLPDSSEIHYRYDPLYLREIQRGEFVHRYEEHDLSGQAIKATLPGKGGALYLQQDRLGRPKELLSTVWKEKELTYDPIGHLLSHHTEDFTSHRSSYSYDQWNQLQQENEHTYKNDSLYNRLTKDTTPYTYNSLHQLLQQGHARYSYDQNGNLTQKEEKGHITDYTYDALDRLIEVTLPTKKIHFTYDAFSRRLSKTLIKGGETALEEKYFYQGENEIGSYEKRRMTSLRVLGSSRGSESGAAVLLELSGNPYIPIHDHSGNVRCLLNALTGQVEEYYRYTAFGEETLFNPDGKELPDSINPWRYASKRIDDETGLLYFGQRYYSPTIGRWITQDPLGFSDGPNLYAYVLNNPLTLTDLYGLFSFSFNPFELFGKVLELVSHYFLPPPLSRTCSTIGRCFQGDFSGYYGNKYPRSHVFESGTIRSENESYIHTNGMNTDEPYYKKKMGIISELFDGTLIRCVYSSCHGFLSGIVKFAAIKFFGFESHSMKVLRSTILEEVERLTGKENPMIHILCESLGGLETYHVMQNLLDEGMIPRDINVDIASFGSAHTFVKDMAKNVTVHNYIAETDPIPRIANQQNVREAMKNEKVTILPCKTNFYHDFSNGPYWDYYRNFNKKRA